MKTQMIKRLVVLATAFTIVFTSIGPVSHQVFAGEAYRLELFSQLAEKVSSLYYKEAMVGLVISDEIYKDPNLLVNIDKHLEKDLDTKNYLLERGFDQNKIKEIVSSIDKLVPNMEDMKNPENKNVIKRLINTTLVEENGTLSFADYDEDIKQFGKKMYEVLPDKAKDALDMHFKTEDEKTHAMIKITIEFLYNGHGKVRYDEATNEYVDLELMINDRFIEAVNSALDFKLLNDNSKRSINIFLSALEDTIESNELTRVYTDISLLLNMVGTNYDLAKMISAEDVEISRVEILKLTLDSLGLEPIEYTGGFTDVKAEDIYSGHISKAKNIGIISGYKDNTFKAMDKITISETMSIINRAVEYLYGNSDLSEGQIDSALKNIKHRDQIENWARASVANLVMLKIIPSDYSGEFGKDVFINKAQAINIINKIQM